MDYARIAQNTLPIVKAEFLDIIHCCPDLLRGEERKRMEEFVASYTNAVIELAGFVSAADRASMQGLATTTI